MGDTIVRKVLLFVFLVMSPELAFCGDLRITGYLGTQGFLIPVAQASSPNLEPNIGVETRYEIAYLFGDANGPVVGLEYNSFSQSTTLDAGQLRPAGTFNTDNYLTMGEIGWWWKFKDSEVRGQATLDYGQGQMFFEQNGPWESVNVSMTELKFSVIIPFDVGIPSVKVVLIPGVGTSVKTVPSFIFNGNTYTQSDFPPLIHTELGLGIQF